MLVTRDVINNFFKSISPSNEDVFSKDGFIALADWSEQQQWWPYFRCLYHIEDNWRTSSMGDPYVFALTLFRFSYAHLRDY